MKTRCVLLALIMNEVMLLMRDALEKQQKGATRERNKKQQTEKQNYCYITSSHTRKALNQKLQILIGCNQQEKNSSCECSQSMSCSLFWIIKGHGMV